MSQWKPKIHTLKVVCFLFLAAQAACRILVPQARIELMSPALGEQSPNLWTAEEAPKYTF